MDVNVKHSEDYVKFILFQFHLSMPVEMSY